MTLAITIETGAVVGNANSYVTVQEVLDYNAQRGVDMTDEDADDVITWLSQAMDYVEGMETRFKGERVQPLLQQLAWPRTGVMLYSTELPTTSIPPQLKNAVCYLTGVVYQGVDLYNVQTTRAVTEETIGPLTTKYSPLQGATVKPMIPNLDSMLAPLFKSGAGQLKSVRV